MVAEVPKQPVPGRVSTWKALFLVLILLSAVIGGLLVWKSIHAAPASWAGGGPVDVVAVKLKGRSAASTLDVPGEIRAVQQVMLTAEVAGKVASIDFKAGQRVKAGDVVVRLDTSVEEASLKAAKAREAFARKQLARARELAPSGAMTREVLQQRQSDYDQSKANVAELLARIHQKRILAPFNGEVGLRRIDLGQYLNAGDATATLTNLDKLFVNFDLPQQQRSSIKLGQPIRIIDQNAGGKALTATISAIEPQVNRDTRNIRVQAVMENKRHLLQPGMYVSVAVSLPANSDTLLLPASAIMTSAYGDTALVVQGVTDKQLGKAKFVQVTVGRRIGDQVVVSHGLSAGDVVVTQGQLRVRPGSQLHVVSGLPGQAAKKGDES